MADSYKLKTYTTLYPWKPSHDEIIKQYERCPNKSDFLRTALEFFASHGFPGYGVTVVKEVVKSAALTTALTSKILFDQ
ncbi:MAG: hypothetical protein KAX49_18445 [Halanaerobiales bacterium]|nr:hypothetical protein [Halanaerobiales bacterium]